MGRVYICTIKLELKIVKDKKMKKISSIMGLGLLSAMFMSFTGANECGPNVVDLKVEDISVIKVEEEIDLGFNTAQYLPIGFNPYKGIILNLDDIVILEKEPEIQLDFDTSMYLPADFNACEGMEAKNRSTDFLKKEEEKFIMEFNDEDYLPEFLDSQAK